MRPLGRFKSPASVARDTHHRETVILTDVISRLEHQDQLQDRHAGRTGRPHSAGGRTSSSGARALWSHESDLRAAARDWPMTSGCATADQQEGPPPGPGRKGRLRHLAHVRKRSGSHRPDGVRNGRRCNLRDACCLARLARRCDDCDEGPCPDATDVRRTPVGVDGISPAYRLLLASRSPSDRFRSCPATRSPRTGNPTSSRALTCLLPLSAVSSAVPAGSRLHPGRVAAVV